MQTAKRLPEVELEKKMVDIRRAHAHFKRDNRLDESRMWQQLFENDKALRSSLVRQYSVDDVLHKKVSLQKQAVKDEDEFLPPSEGMTFSSMLWYQPGDDTKVGIPVTKQK